ncbi:MAG: tRNA 2-thiocytidine(32) synthetase TtcA, partial [Cyclobacteriaceae bacterium]
MDWQVPFEIIVQDTYSVVKEKTPFGKSYCSLCSRMRRGILYDKARKFGCNKVALGHHMDDVLETFLLNTFFSGQLSTMPPNYLIEAGDL